MTQKRPGVRQPLDPKDVPQAAWKLMKTIVDASTVIADPEPAKIRARMKELREMGIHDLPVVRGMSSSMRTLAIHTCILDRDKTDKPTVFVTAEPEIIDRAAAIEARFPPIKIMPVLQWMKMMKEAQNDESI